MLTHSKFSVNIKVSYIIETLPLIDIGSEGIVVILRCYDVNCV